MMLRKLRPALRGTQLFTPGELVTLAYIEAADEWPDSEYADRLANALDESERATLSAAAIEVLESFPRDSEVEGFSISYVTPERPAVVSGQDESMIPISFVRELSMEK